MQLIYNSSRKIKRNRKREKEKHNLFQLLEMSSASRSESEKYEFIIVGGGVGGTTCAERVLSTLFTHF